MKVDEQNFSVESLKDVDILCLFGYENQDIESQLTKWRDLGGKEVLFIDSRDAFSLEDFMVFSRSCVDLHFCYVVNPNLTKAAFQEMQELASLYQSVEWHSHHLLSDVQDLGVRVFSNILCNYELSDPNLLIQLKDIYKGVPAVIVGAGPSLETSLDYLKELEDKALIFAGGASLKRSPVYHIAGGLDPDPCRETSEMDPNIEVPFFYESRFSSTALNHVSGPILQVTSLEGLHIEDCKSSIDTGCTVTTMLLSLALHLGCGPIFLVGMDLAYGEKGDKYSENEPDTQGDSSLVSYQDRLTQKDWVVASKWMENCIHMHSKESFYSPETSGLEIQGVQELSLEDLKAMDLGSFDVQGLVHELKRKAFSPDPDKDLRLDLVEKFKESLIASQRSVEKVLGVFERVYPKDPSAEGSFLLHLFDLNNEIVYQKLLRPLWELWRLPIERKLEGDYAKHLHKWLFFQRVLENHLR